MCQAKGHKHKGKGELFMAVSSYKEMYFFYSALTV